MEKYGFNVMVPNMALLRRLIDSGVPKNEIVLGFRSPEMRKDSVNSPSRVTEEHSPINR